MPTPDHTETTAAPQEVRDLFAAIKSSHNERATYVAAAIEAAESLARFAWKHRHQSDSATVVARALASVYNGYHAAPVRLDELRWLDWKRQRELIAVIFGTGAIGTEDTHIRKAFHAAGGQEAVDWLHSFLEATT